MIFICKTHIHINRNCTKKNNKLLKNLLFLLFFKQDRRRIIYNIRLRVHKHGRSVRLRLFNHHVDNTTGDSERKCDIDGTGVLVKQFAPRFHQAIQVQLGKDNLQTALQIAHAILLVCVMFHNVFNCLVGDNNLIRLECHL